MKRVTVGLVLGLMIFLASCSEYRKVLKSQDMQYKYDMALNYYKAEKFAKAYPLLEELYIVYRGSEKGEKIAYYQAKCDYAMNDVLLSAHRFGQFAKNYPNSEHAEECQFMSAYCNYLMSPKYSLDQADTKKAIRSLQLFTLSYPESERIDTCNSLLDELRQKLEVKEYNSAKLYLKMENYQAAKVAFDNFNKSYPGSVYREESTFNALKSGYNLAINSVDEKKMDRVEEAMKAYVNFADRFPQSKKLRDAESMYDSLVKLKSEGKKNS